MPDSSRAALRLCEPRIIHVPRCRNRMNDWTEILGVLLRLSVCRLLVSFKVASANGIVQLRNNIEFWLMSQKVQEPFLFEKPGRVRFVMKAELDWLQYLASS